MFNSQNKYSISIIEKNNKKIKLIKGAPDVLLKYTTNYIDENGKSKYLDKEKLMKDTFVLDVDGEEVICEVILGFTDDATGKEYIIYTDNSSDEDDQLNIYASQVDPEDADNILPIETEEEYAFVQEVLDSMMSEDEE